METGGLIGIIFGIIVVIGGSMYVSMQKKTNTNSYDLPGSQYYGHTKPQSYPFRYKSLYGYGNYDSSSSYNNSYKRTGYRKHGGTRRKLATKNKTQRL